MASDATRKIITAAPELSEDLLLEFTNFLSVVGERLCNSNTRYILYSMTLLILPLFVVLNFFSFSPLSERCTHICVDAQFYFEDKVEFIFDESLLLLLS